MSSGDGPDLVAVAAGEQRASRVPSVVVAAARESVVHGVAAVGRADVEAGVAAEAGVAYRIGSITKTFTAVVVLDLVERGRLGLDDPVGRHLAGTSFGEVPIRMLLAHLGGLQREVPVDMWESMVGPDAGALREAFAWVESVDAAGARWHYSNLGYAVLGAVVEAVTGKACTEVIDAQLLGPLGLTSTSWTRPGRAAVGYRLDPYADIVHREPEMDQGAVGVAGQLWSTAGDLLVWGDALAGGMPKVVSPWVVKTMHTVAVMVDRVGWTRAWGLGLILDRRGDRIVAGHTGAMPGFLAGLAVDWGSRSVGVVLTNVTRGVNVGALAADVALDLAETPLAETPLTWVPDVAVPAELVGVLGRWWSEAEETVFSWRSRMLQAELVVGGDVTLFARTGPDGYRAVAGRLAGERLLIRRGADGAVTGLEWATYPFSREPR